MSHGWTFITGATGFIGHYVLAGLLRRGERCIAMLRNDGAKRLPQLLKDAAPELVIAPDQLRIVDGALPNEWPTWDGTKIDRVVHVAGNTTFRRAGEEPARTNVEGTAQLLAWMDALAIADLTHVSTAYVCGADPSTAIERIQRTPPPFQNDYEASKWQAEQLVADWATRAGRRLAVARPAIVTGAYESGRATEFRGFYAVARAVEQLSRSYDERPREQRLQIPLRLRGRADAPNQIVPVDWAARAIARLALDRSASGVFHLAHPRPPSNAEIKRMLETIFDVGGGRFVGDEEIFEASQSAEERAFHGGTQPLAAYFSHSPRFDCSRSLAVLGPDAEVPAIDLAYVRRCIDFARVRRWGRQQPLNTADAARFGSAYFERFLPDHLPNSLVSRVQPVRATIRFVVENHEWLCRFADGRLETVRRDSGAAAEEFGYRTTAAGFWRAISGVVDGEQLFASGEADVFGNIEAALKMSAILREFTREFPCDRGRLEPYLVGT